MKKDTHYGTIPGTPKPTLYKPGAEVLCVTFRIAPSYSVEDLSDDLTARYRITCHGTHQVTGIALGDGLGECSSAEEKYKWREAICAEEFDLTPEIMRRLKFKKYQNNVTKKTQVRTEAADLSNTVLKMACKRAMIAMTLNVTAASDIFTQDIEDLPEELRPQEGVQTSSQKPGPAPHDPELAAHWIAQANAAATPEALTEVWKAGVSAINEVKDMTSYEAFKVAVGARGVTLKAEAAKPDPDVKPVTETTVVSDDEVEFEEVEE